MYSFAAMLSAWLVDEDSCMRGTSSILASLQISRHECSAFSDLLTENSNACSRLAAELNTARQQLAQQRQSCAQLQLESAVIGEMTETMQAQERRQREMTDMLESMRQQVAMGRQDLHQAKSSATDLAAQLDQANRRATDLATQLGQTQQQLDQTQQQLSQATVTIESQRRRLENISAAVRP